MRLSTIWIDDRTRAAVADGVTWTLLDHEDVGALLRSPRWRDEAARALRDPAPTRVPASTAKLARPVLAPGKIICCGLNYRDHIAETGRETPEHPTLFAKYPDALVDPGAQIEVVGSSKVDWEGELVVVVGAPLHRPTLDEAQAGIAGYTVANDVSMRDWQARTLQWFQGKSWAASTPVGPVIVTADEIDPVAGLTIETRVNGEVVQSSSTRELLFDSTALLAYVAAFTPLSPGDLVLTGTPSGVGLGLRPQRFLENGDVLMTTIEGIGTIENRFSIVP